MKRESNRRNVNDEMMMMMTTMTSRALPKQTWPSNKNTIIIQLCNEIYQRSIHPNVVPFEIGEKTAEGDSETLELGTVLLLALDGAPPTPPPPPTPIKCVTSIESEGIVVDDEDEDDGAYFSDDDTAKDEEESFGDEDGAVLIEGGGKKL